MTKLFENVNGQFRLIKEDLDTVNEIAHGKIRYELPPIKTITVVSRGDDYIAYLNDNTEQWDADKSFNSAIGKAIINRSTKSNLVKEDHDETNVVGNPEENREVQIAELVLAKISEIQKLPAIDHTIPKKLEDIKTLMNELLFIHGQ